MTIGIYILEFGDKVYVGQSSNIEKRYTEHCYALGRGECNAKVQAVYAELKTLPTLKIIHECALADLDALEEKYISEYDAINSGLNIAAGSMKVLRGENHYNSKYTNAQISEVFNLLCEVPTIPLVEIAASTNISIHVIQSISSGVSHRWLQDKYPDKYQQLLINKGSRISVGSSARGRRIKYPPILSPDNNVYYVDNAAAFAKLHGLNHSHLVGVLNGKRITHKGWKVYKEVTS